MTTVQFQRLETLIHEIANDDGVDAEELFNLVSGTIGNYIDEKTIEVEV